MQPPPRRAMSGAAARAHQKLPLTFVSNERANASSSTAETGISRPDAELFTRMSRYPKRSSISSNIRATCAGCATEARNMSTAAPAASSSAFVSFACSSEWKKLSRMCAPRAASSRATTFPTPLPPPVTRASFPSRSLIVRALSGRRSTAVGC